MKRWTWLSLTIAALLVVGGIGAIAATTRNFDGLGNGFSGPAGTMVVTADTPDPSGDISPNHYVEAVNAQLAVFDRDGVATYGPVPLNTLFAGFGGDCEANNDGHATVLYDQMADRWMIAQLSMTGADGSTRPFLMCVAVSLSPDPAGAYARYAFPTSSLPISPTLAVWPDGYYMTADVAGGSIVCAYDRVQMLNGQPATQQCFPSVRGVLPADLDGAIEPFSGTPARLLSLGSDKASLELWALRVDWATPGNSLLSGPFALPVAAWTDPASPSVPQSGGGLLNPAAGRLMRRVAYRINSDGWASIVSNHTVDAGSTAAIRWYEIRIPPPFVDAQLSVAQQGTWSPNTDSRWVGGIAMDKNGNIALGYSVSGGSLRPELRYTGRLAGDAAGTMTQSETTIVAGTGSQDGSLDVWGRHSSMTVDPTDDCTFWFAGEYLPSDGTRNWRTRIAAFALPGCVTPLPDFDIGISPSSRTTVPGSSATYTVSTTAINGSNQSITLTVTGLPSGVTGSFSPASVVAGGTSTLTVSAAANVLPSTTAFTVAGTSGAAVRSAAASLTVTNPLTTALTNNVPVPGLSGASGSTKYFVLTVPAGQETLTFTLTGTSGDADLYVRRGSVPTTTQYDCRPFDGNSFETCTFDNPGAGNWYVMIRGFTAYANVTLIGAYYTTAPLTNDVPVTGVSGASGSQRFFKLEVPANQASLAFTISGGTGDADLYVRFGSKPTTSTWNCRPRTSDSSETCTFTTPKAGTWYVMIRGHAAFSGVTLTPHYTADSTTLLANGVPVSFISSSKGTQKFWRMAVPGGRPSVTFTISGGSGDADLYVRFGAKPTTSTFTCRPYLVGNNETCTITNPQAGDWFVMLNAYKTFTGVTLKGQY